jgi:hypothetical protein
MSNVRRALAQFDAHAFVRKHGGRKESSSALSQEYLLNCPACGSSRLRWNAAKKQGAWTCWGCHRSGDTLSLVRLLERTTDMGAIDFVMQGYVGGDQPTNLEPLGIVAPRAPQRATVKHLPAISWPHGVDLLAPVPAHARAFDYLRGRKHFGVDPALLAPHRVGFGRSGRLDGYLVFPCWMDNGLAYWQGRATWDPPAGTDEEVRAWKESTGYRKTLNPVAVPGAATASDVIFGFDHARTAEHVVVCEGPFDAAQIGIPSTAVAGVALLGKAWSDQKLARLARLPARRVTVYLDRGRDEWESACRLAAALSPYVETYLAVPPEGCDAGSLTPQHNAVVLAHATRYAGQALQGV